MTERLLLSGNEAIARGAHEAAVGVVSGYPGTPSTEIIESIVQYPDLYAEWAPNEKVALEVAIGASLAGVRAMATMKHVGVNVAADPLMTVTYMGVRGGLVIVTADDPGMHSSQNEQDNRHYARFAKVPMLEPSDSQEAKDMTRRAFALSEQFDTPVFLRTTTRISHSKGLADTAEPESPAGEAGFERNQAKLVMIPANARRRHPVVEDRLEALRRFAEETDLNRAEYRDKKVGVVTGGIAYQYVREALPEASIFKLGLSYPLPIESLRSFAQEVETLFVVEELDPFWETEMRAAGIACVGKEAFPRTGELNVTRVRKGLRSALGASEEMDGKPVPEGIPARPPVLCPGCPHRGVFYVLNKLKVTVTGDIGCYTLGVMPPHGAIDTTTCMGASIGHAMGIEKALGEQAPPMVAVIGDSTFIHSGLTGLAEVAYNRGRVTTVIMDNRTTAMTGHQGNPASGYGIRRDQETPRLDFAQVGRALGIEDVRVVDPYDLEATERAIRAALEHDGPSLVVSDRPCVLLDRRYPPSPSVKADNCRECGLCFRLGCPAIEAQPGEHRSRPAINPVLCTGCGMCLQVCKFDAIGREEEEGR